MEKKSVQGTPLPAENTGLRYIIPALVFVSAFIVFLPALKNGFVSWDDLDNFVNNPNYRGLGWEQLKWMFTTFHTGPYQPLSWLSYGLDYLVWGMNPAGYHLTNVILHSLNAFIFCLLCAKLLEAAAGPEKRLGADELYYSAGFAALVFALHPLRVESVAWATERRDVLSGLFYLLTLLAYIRPFSACPGKASSWRQNIPPLFLFLLALLSKGIVITLPLALLILDVYPLRRLPSGPSGWFARENRAVWLEKIPYFILAAVFGVIGYIGQSRSGAVAGYSEFGLGSRAAQFFFSGGFYIWKTLVPLNLAPLYHSPAGFSLADWQPLLGAAVLLSITAALFMSRRSWPAALAAWLYYLVTLAPVSGIVKLSTQMAADRYTYLACLGFAALSGGGVKAGINSLKKPLVSAVVPAAFLAAAVLGGMSWRQIGIWRDSETLWRHTLSINDGLQFAHNNLGVVLFEKGKPEEAMEHYNKALRINPENADAHTNMGVVLFTQGKPGLALSRYQEALRIAPNRSDVRANMGAALAALNRREEALEYLREALKADPANADAHYNMGCMLAYRGEFNEAAVHYKESLRIRPGFAKLYYNLGVVLAAQGKTEDAVKQYREALRLKPDFVEAHINLSAILFNQGRKEEALFHCREALRISPDNVQARNNLSAMLKSPLSGMK